MWEIATQDKTTGEITARGTFKTLEEAKSNPSAATDAAATYYLWVGEWPDDHDAMEAIMKEEFDANPGVEFRITPNLEISDSAMKVAGCRCPGRCFCVSSGGRCRCETVYRGRWYPCPGRC